MKEYKRKRQAEYYATDHPPKDIKKQLNSSERWRGKREVENQLEDADYYWTPPTVDELYIEEYEKRRAREESTPCAQCLIGYAALDRLGATLYRLGYVILTDYGRDNYTCKHKQEK